MYWICDIKNIHEMCYCILLKYKEHGTLLTRITWTASYPDMQKIRRIGFLFENRLHWQCEFRLL